MKLPKKNKRTRSKIKALRQMKRRHERALLRLPELKAMRRRLAAKRLANRIADNLQTKLQRSMQLKREQRNDIFE